MTDVKQVVAQFCWSPDGKCLSLSGNLDNTLNPENWKTYIISLDGSLQQDATKYTNCPSNVEAMRRAIL